VYRQHENCRCIVEYVPGGVKRQNVHTEQWADDREADKIGARKVVSIGQLIPEHLAAHPARLASYTPESLMDTLKEAGFDVRPLARGRLKGISFELGGGYKMNSGASGLLQYHPAEYSHHEGAYYKISTEEGGTQRYDLDGTKKTKRNSGKN
jgi:hypothetical protein